MGLITSLLWRGLDLSEPAMLRFKQWRAGAGAEAEALYKRPSCDAIDRVAFVKDARYR